MKPLLGLPGISGLALISSLHSFGSASEHYTSLPYTSYTKKCYYRANPWLNKILMMSL